jgi:hypothetical protein
MSENKFLRIFVLETERKGRGKILDVANGEEIRCFVV